MKRSDYEQLKTVVVMAILTFFWFLMLSKQWFYIWSMDFGSCIIFCYKLIFELMKCLSC